MKKVNRIILIGFGVLLFLNGGFFAWFMVKQNNKEMDTSVVIESIPTPKPLLVYTFDNLTNRKYEASKIEIGEEIEEYSGEKYEARLFSFLSDGKKVTGQINMPMTTNSRKFPVIIMLRGYVDREIYRTGIGTNRAAGVLAANGYVTLAPDFLGYGGSDMPDDDVWWDRFNNPVIVMNLIASLENLEIVDTSRVGIWGHSNGGQIALSVLEISQANYPTSLWAPVTKPFPYSILYFTDEFSDRGKALRAEIARLEADYDVDEFSIDNYFDWIESPIQIHQGTNDEAVPLRWSNEFVDKMKDLEKEIEYFVWNGAGHNMEGSWSEVVIKDLDFFKKNLLD